MGWISDRNMRSGGSINPNPGKQRRGPYRKIVATLRPSTGMFDPAYVELECGHRTQSHGLYNARCVKCGDIETALAPPPVPAAPKDIRQFIGSGELTQEAAKALFSYDSDTGVLTRLVGSSRRVGRPVGHLASGGAWRTKIAGKSYSVSRVIWLLVHGCMPELEIDHLDGNPLNNRLANLRLASRQQNAANRGKQSNNTSGFKGVYLRKDTGRWNASIVKDGKKVSLGNFDTREAAYAAYCAHAPDIHGEFARTS